MDDVIHFRLLANCRKFNSSDLPNFIVQTYFELELWNLIWVVVCKIQGPKFADPRMAIVSPVNFRGLWVLPTEVPCAYVPLHFK